MTPIECLTELVALKDMAKEAARLRYEWDKNGQRNDSLLERFGRLDSDGFTRGGIAWAWARHIVKEQSQ